MVVPVARIPFGLSRVDACEINTAEKEQAAHDTFQLMWIQRSGWQIARSLTCYFHILKYNVISRCLRIHDPFSKKEKKRKKERKKKQEKTRKKNATSRWREESTPAGDMTYWFHSIIAIGNCYHHYLQHGFEKQAGLDNSIVWPDMTYMARKTKGRQCLRAHHAWAKVGWKVILECSINNKHVKRTPANSLNRMTLR